MSGTECPLDTGQRPVPIRSSRCTFQNGWWTWTMNMWSTFLCASFRHNVYAWLRNHNDTHDNSGNARVDVVCGSNNNRMCRSEHIHSLNVFFIEINCQSIFCCMFPFRMPHNRLTQNIQIIATCSALSVLFGKSILGSLNGNHVARRTICHFACWLHVLQRRRRRRRTLTLNNGTNQLKSIRINVLCLASDGIAQKIVVSIR